MITIEREAVLEAIQHSRVHLERADQAARVCLQSDREAQSSTNAWAQELFTRDSEQAGQHVTIEQDKAIDAITQLIAEVTSQDVTIMGAQE